MAIPINKSVFKLDFLLVDDDESLIFFVKTVLETRKLRLACQNLIRARIHNLVEVKTTIYHANNANDARKELLVILESYPARGRAVDSHDVQSIYSGHCVIGFLDFDMPGENGLELAYSIKYLPIETILFTGRLPIMQAYLKEKALDTCDFGIDHLMLKGAPSHEFNQAILDLLERRLDIIYEKTTEEE